MKSKYYEYVQLLIVSLGLAIVLWLGSQAGGAGLIQAQGEVTPTPDNIPSAGAIDPVSAANQPGSIGTLAANLTQQDIRRIESYDASTNTLIVYHEHRISGDFSGYSTWWFGPDADQLLDVPSFTRTGTATCVWVTSRRRFECRGGSLTSFTYSYRWQTKPTLSNNQFNLLSHYSWSGPRVNITTDFHYPAALTSVNSTLMPNLNETGHLRWTVLDTTLFQTTLTFATGTHTIAGRVTDSNGDPLSAVTLSTGSGQSAVTGSDGRYTLNNLTPGEHTVTPSRNGYSFSPAYRTVNVGPNSASGVDFTGSADARLVTDPTELRFFTTIGSNPVDQSFTIENAGSGRLIWRAAEEIPWLTLNRTVGLAPRSVLASVDASGLDVGRHTGQITLTSAQAVNSPLVMDVTLDVGCNPRRDVDVMLVIDVSGSMRGQPLRNAKEAANAFLDRIDLNRDQGGLVSFNAAAALNSQLTADDEHIRNVTNSLYAYGNTDIAEAVQLATSELQSERAATDHQPVIILLSDGRQTVAGDPVAAAQTAKNAGITVVTIGLGNADQPTLQAMASTPANYYYTPNASELEDIYEQLSVTIGCPSEPEPAELVISPEAIEFSTTLGGPVPAPHPLQVTTRLGQTIPWTATEGLPWLTLAPTAGQTPNSLMANVDMSGLAAGYYTGQITFTSPEAINSPVTVEVGLDIKCTPRSPVDVALVIDVSPSMQGTPLVNAKSAAIAFVNEMDLRADQVTLISFSGSARVEQMLTSDGATIKSKIEALTIGNATNITDAIAKARGELNSNRHKPSNQPVIILLTDGKPNRGGSPISQATAAKDEGIYIITIGLIGSQGLDSNLLRTIASTPTDYYETPNPTDLVQIYRNIASQVGCPHLEIEPQTLHFDLSNGATTGSLPVTIDNRQGSPINWTVSEDIPWLTVTQSSGSTPATFNVNIDATGLTSGQHEGTLTFASPVALNSPQTMSVSLSYQAAQDDDHTIYLPFIIK